MGCLYLLANANYIKQILKNLAFRAKNLYLLLISVDITRLNQIKAIRHSRKYGF